MSGRKKKKRILQILKTTLSLFSYSDSLSHREMEEDPFFTDGEFSGSEHLLSLSREDRKSSARTPIAETVNRWRKLAFDFLSSSPHTSRRPLVFYRRRCISVSFLFPHSFLCLVPQEAKTSQHVQGAGYDTYVHDALKSVRFV